MNEILEDRYEELADKKRVPGRGFSIFEKKRSTRNAQAVGLTAAVGAVAATQLACYWTDSETAFIDHNVPATDSTQLAFIINGQTVQAMDLTDYYKQSHPDVIDCSYHTTGILTSDITCTRNRIQQPDILPTQWTEYNKATQIPAEVSKAALPTLASSEQSTPAAAQPAPVEVQPSQNDPIEATHETSYTPFILGGTVMAAGVLYLVMRNRFRGDSHRGRRASDYEEDFEEE